jgi:negative regulator of sigma E activity
MESELMWLFVFQGSVLQTELTKKLEAILEAEDVRSEAYREAPRTRESFRSTPVFLSADDYDSTMPEVSTAENEVVLASSVLKELACRSLERSNRVVAGMSATWRS